MAVNDDNVEKIEIKKGDRWKILTGTFTRLKNGEVEIRTVKGEVYIYKEEQVMERYLNPTDVQKQLENH